MQDKDTELVREGKDIPSLLASLSLLALMLYGAFLIGQKYRQDISISCPCHCSQGEKAK